MKVTYIQYSIGFLLQETTLCCLVSVFLFPWQYPTTNIR